MYTLQVTPQFKRDAIRCKHQGKDLRLMWEVVEILLRDGEVPESYNPHLLHKEYAGHWECHIDDDWLLVWKKNEQKVTLLLTNTGSHDELFSKKK